MPTYGYRGDVNNSIGVTSAYPGSRTGGDVGVAANRYRLPNNDKGELDVAAPNRSNPEPMPVSNGVFGKPSNWWIGFVVIFGLFIWVSRKYSSNTETRFSNIRISVYNGVFLTLWVVLILNLLKVFATKFKIPGLSELILAA